MKNDLDQILRDSFRELVDEVRATTDTRQALAALYTQADTTATPKATPKATSKATPNVVAMPPTTHRRRRPLAGGPRRRRLAPLGAAVAAMLATVLAAPLFLHSPTPVTPEAGPGADVVAGAESTAVTVLAATAAAAARAPDPTLGPGEYWYIREHGPRVGTNYDQVGSPRSYNFWFMYTQESWWALDGSKLSRETLRRTEFLTADDRAKWIAEGRPKFGTDGRVTWEDPGTTDQSDGWLPMTYKQIQQVPTDPARLTEVLSERLYAGQPDGQCPIPPDVDLAAIRCPHRPVTDGDLFGGILFLLGHYPLPAELRSALYQVLTQLDGVRLLGDATDVAGRRGVGITMDGPSDEAMQTRTEFIFDPDTGQVLGLRRVLTAAVPGWNLVAGMVMDDVAFETAVVDSRPARPKGDPDA